MRKNYTTPAYAEYITLMLESKAETKEAIEIFKSFGEASGLAINKAKSKGMDYQNKDRHVNQDEIHWVQ